MAVTNISTEVTYTNRWSQAQMDKEVAFLKSYSPGFQKLLDDIPSTINGVQVNGIVVTDNAARFSNGRWSSSEQVEFNAAEGVLYVGINPNNTGRDQITGRVMSVGELLSHGLGHFTEKGIAASFVDPLGMGAAEQVAIDYANGVGRDFGLSPLKFYQVSNFEYGPLFCTQQNPQGAGAVPLFISNCFPAGTLIALPGQKFAAIQDVQIGVSVLSFDPNSHLGVGPAVPRA
jgi:hypothetical protein